MPRSLNLRQIEAFKAVMEKGTVSSAAETLYISQPAVSKLIAHFEMDVGLQLFDRVRGRLVPTPLAQNLHREIERIFSGIGQLERAVESIRRAERGQIIVGVTAMLAGTFIKRVMTSFLAKQPNAVVTVQSNRSPTMPELLAARTIDIGLAMGGLVHPEVDAVPLLDQPLVCIMPKGHPLIVHDVIEARHLDGQDFVSFQAGGYTRKRIDRMLTRENVMPRIVLEASAGPTVSEFVALGLGVSLVHPVLTLEMSDAIEVRPFRPETGCGFTICRNRADNRRGLIEDFLTATNTVARKMFPASVG